MHGGPFVARAMGTGRWTSSAPSTPLALILVGATPFLLGALLPARPWLVLSAGLLVASFAAASAAGARDDEAGLRRTMVLLAGSALALLLTVVAGGRLWPLDEATDRAALIASVLVVGLGAPSLSFDYRRLEGWYVISALLATTSVASGLAVSALALLGVP